MKGVEIPPVSEKELNYGSEEWHHHRLLRVWSHLIVLDGEIGTSLAFLVRNLHKVSTHQCPSDIHVMPGLVFV